MDKINDYILELFKGIPKSKEKDELINSIVQSLEEKVEDLVESGKSEEDAINKAIVEFGNVEEIKKEFLLNQGLSYSIYKIRNRLLFSIMGTLLIIGLFLFVNFYYTPEHIWFVFPVFVVLWWPLAETFNFMNKKNR